MSERRRDILTLVATILGSTVVFLDATVINVALPAIRDDLDTDLSAQQWVVDAYMLALVALLLVGGSLGDQFGRRRIFNLGLAAFGVTSVLCAIAPTTELLIAGRALQGLAGALLVPGSLAIVAATFHGAERGWAVGTWTAWSGIATVIGPAGGGALVDELSWRWIFWINVPVIALTLLLTLRVVRESVDPDAGRGVDWRGILYSAIGLGGPVFALIEQPGRGWDDPLVWGPMAGGILFLGLFLLVESRIRRPMMPLGLFRIRNFAVTNLATFVVYAALYGGSFLIVIYLQETAGYSALDAGLATTPVSILLFVLSPYFGKMASGTGPRLPMTAGPIIGGIGFLLLTRAGASPDYLRDVLPGVFLFGLGLSITVAPLTATVLDSVEERRAGIASGINNGISRVGGLLAIAVLGAVAAGQFASEVDEGLATTRLGKEAEMRVEDAKQTPFAPADTEGLPSGERQAIDPAVSDASESSFDVGMVLAGGLMIFGGMVSGVGIRNPKRPRERPAPRIATAAECGREPSEPVPVASGAELT